MQLEMGGFGDGAVFVGPMNMGEKTQTKNSNELDI